MKRVLALLALLALLAAIPARADDELIDNAEYKAWSGYKVGAFVSFEEITSVNSKTHRRKLTLRLKELTDERAVLEVESYFVSSDRDMRTAESGRVHKAKVKKIVRPADPKVTLRDSVETIEVGGEKLECRAVEVSVETPHGPMRNKEWRTPWVPGGLVKQESRSQGAKDLVTMSTVAVKWGDGR